MINMSATPTASDIHLHNMSMQNMLDERVELKALIHTFVPEVTIEQSKDGSEVIVTVSLNNSGKQKIFSKIEFIKYYNEDEIVQITADVAQELYYSLLKEVIQPKISVIRQKLIQQEQRGSL